jgi:hypothetical protein
MKKQEQPRMMPPVATDTLNPISKPKDENLDLFSTNSKFDFFLLI